MTRSVLYLVMMSVCTVVPSYKAHLSDAWYPQNKKILRSTLQSMQTQVSQELPFSISTQSVKGILVPHAGYEYSGVVASSAYQVITPSYFKRVIVLAPLHHVAVVGAVLPSVGYDSYKNSLGVVPFDVEIIKKLHSEDPALFGYHASAYGLEHSFEIQLPFIQQYCGADCKVIPLLFGDVSNEQMERIARILSQHVDDTTLIVASSDLVHFGSNFNYQPFKSHIYQQLVDLDSLLVQSIQKLQVPEFLALIKKTKAPVCGVQPIQLLMRLMRGYNVTSYVTGYDRSSKQEQNPEHSVSYVGMVFAQKKRSELPLQDRLTGYEKQVLRKIVSQVLQHVDRTDCTFPNLITDALREDSGAFVTLYDAAHNLRGCIGTTYSTKPLCEQVCLMAQAAALHDNRFNPVTQAEAATLTYSISVLTKPNKIDSFKKIRIGTDGVILTVQGHTALFLPKVAIEFGWDAVKLLQELSIKAGLAGDAWKQSDAMLQVFQSIDF